MNLHYISLALIFILFIVVIVFHSKQQKYATEQKNKNKLTNLALLGGTGLSLGLNKLLYDNINSYADEGVGQIEDTINQVQDNINQSSRELQQNLEQVRNTVNTQLTGIQTRVQNQINGISSVLTNNVGQIQSDIANIERTYQSLADEVTDYTAEHEEAITNQQEFDRMFETVSQQAGDLSLQATTIGNSVAALNPKIESNKNLLANVSKQAAQNKAAIGDPEEGPDIGGSLYARTIGNLNWTIGRDNSLGRELSSVSQQAAQNKAAIGDPEDERSFDVDDDNVSLYAKIKGNSWLSQFNLETLVPISQQATRNKEAIGDPGDDPNIGGSLYARINKNKEAIGDPDDDPNIGGSLYARTSENRLVSLDNVGFMNTVNSKAVQNKANITSVSQQATRNKEAIGDRNDGPSFDEDASLYALANTSDVIRQKLDTLNERIGSRFDEASFDDDASLYARINKNKEAIGDPGDRASFARNASLYARTRRNRSVSFDNLRFSNTVNSKAEQNKADITSVSQQAAQNKEAIGDPNAVPSEDQEASLYARINYNNLADLGARDAMLELETQIQTHSHNE